MSKKGGAGRKTREHAIETLRHRIEEHRQKLADRPNDPSVPHWLIEITAFRQQIERHERRLRRG